MTIEEHLELLRVRLGAIEHWEADIRRIHHAQWRHEDWWMVGNLGATLIAAQRAASEMSFWARKVAEIAAHACSQCGGRGGATGLGGIDGYDGPCHAGPYNGKTGKGDKA